MRPRFGFYRNRDGIQLWGVHNRRTLPNRELVRIKAGEPSPTDVNAACQIAWLRKWNCIVPIPSAKPLARKLAEHIARKLRVRIRDALFKSKRISTIPVRFRRREAAKLFRATKRVPKRVLLVDDYITTGSSMLAAARALAEMGAEEIWGLALRIV